MIYDVTDINKKEWFAGMALQGLLAGGRWKEFEEIKARYEAALTAPALKPKLSQIVEMFRQQIIEEAYIYADLMEREGRSEIKGDCE
mgnify:CR=1 FL=1